MFNTMKTIPVNQFPEIPDRDLRRDADAAAWFAQRVDEHEHFERLASRAAHSIWFRFSPGGRHSSEVDELNMQLLRRVNDHGEVRLSDGVLDGRVALRLAFSGAGIRGDEVRRAWDVVSAHAASIASERRR